MEKTITFLQARMSSSRLPGKVLRPICGTPMILLQIERMKRAKNTGKIIVLTSTETSDDILVETLNQKNLPVFRGSLENVLDRFFNAAINYPAEHYIRTTADCPLIDPYILDQVIEKHLSSKNDYTSNILERTFPVGTDVEIFTRETLEITHENAKTEYEKEHVTPYIYNHPELFKLGNLKNITNHSNLRWTVDTPEDFEFASKAYEKLYHKNRSFTYEDILKFSLFNRQQN